VRVNSIPERIATPVTPGRTNKCVGHWLIVIIVRRIGAPLQTQECRQPRTMEHFIHPETNSRIVVRVVSRKLFVQSIVCRCRRDGIRSHGSHADDRVAASDHFANPVYRAATGRLIGRWGKRTPGARW
jgi:hypothetical protein